MWNVLRYLIETAYYIRFLDGFMGKISLDILKELGIRNVAVVRMPPHVHGAKNGRTMNVALIPKDVPTKKWLTEWAFNIGRQVNLGKIFSTRSFGKMAIGSQWIG